MRIVLLSPGLFRRPLVWLISSFWLVLILIGEGYPVRVRTIWGFLRSWNESLTIAVGVRGVRVGVLGRWLVWRYFRACFVSRSGGFVGLFRVLLLVTLVFGLPPWALGAVRSPSLD